MSGERPRRGRRPLRAGHVDGLEGSEAAKRRMRVLLLTLQGELSVAEACQELGVGESRLHALRHQWLQESLELLEPRPCGRPPRLPEAEADEAAKLAERLAETEQRLALAEARQEIQSVLGPTPTAKKPP